MNFLTMICLLPVAAFWAARWFFFRNVIDQVGSHDCRISVETLVEKLHFAGKIPKSMKDKRTAEHLAEMLMISSFESLKTQHPQPVILRKRADTWILLVPPFSLMIAAFAFFVAKNLTLILLCVALVNALAAIFKFTTRQVATLAADQAIEKLRRIRIPRQADEEPIIACIRALVWK